MNMIASPMTSPMNYPRTHSEADTADGDAKTFVASHLLFSHLMDLDGKKNKMSDLNEANRSTLMQIGI